MAGEAITVNTSPTAPVETFGHRIHGTAHGLRGPLDLCVDHLGGLPDLGVHGADVQGLQRATKTT